MGRHVAGRWTSGSCVVALVTAVCFAADPEPDSVKLFIKQDRMYRVTGAQLAEAFEDCNKASQAKEQLGPELLTLGAAAQDEEDETSALGALGDFQGTLNAGVSVVEAADAPGVQGAGRYCLRVVRQAEGRSSVGLTRHWFLLEPNKRYQLSCLVFHNDEESMFLMHAYSERTNYHDTLDRETNEYFSTAPPGQWARIAAEFWTPDIGACEYMFAVSNFVTTCGPWYVDGPSVREVGHVTERRPYRPKTAAEDALRLEDLHVDRINLYSAGHTVPVLLEGIGPDGTLHPETTITFWGDAPRGEETWNDPFTTENAYTLRFNSPDAPHRFEERDAKEIPSHHHPVATTYPRTAHLEHDSLLQHYQEFVGYPTDRRMWCRFKSPPRATGHELELDLLPDVADGTQPTAFRMLLWGSSHLPKEPDHDWHVRLNDGFLGHARWDDRRHLLFESEAVGTYFKPDEVNVLRFVNVHEDHSPDVITLDWIEIDYVATFEPLREYVLNDDPANHAVRTMPHFVGASIRVYDGTAGVALTVPTHRSRRTGLYYAEYYYPFTGGPRRFRAVGPKGYQAPERLQLGYSSHLRGITQVPEYLVIAHAQFMPSLEPLLELRRAQGLDVLAVDVEDVYDEYNNGVFSPEAIRRFLDDLLAKAGNLRYVFLVGDATYDYAGLRDGTPNFVPTHQQLVKELSIEHAPTFAQDDYFVYGTGGEGRLPKAAVGRLPCSRIEAIEAYIAKVLEYEQGPAPLASSDERAWYKRAVLISSPE
ncbi:MAG TPA: hypothetical protein ENN80_09905, partial [Candidatus Hydrogenedentes bacterium]|nr:hypothetical protein [Candidatus Hydrogenedentota bacterium]